MFEHHVEMAMTGSKAFKMGENRTSAGEQVKQTNQLFLQLPYAKLNAFPLASITAEIENNTKMIWGYLEYKDET